MLNWLTKAGLRAASISMVVMMLSIVLEVVGRQFFNFSFLIVDELSGYLLVAIAFLGVAHSMRAGAMIRVDFLLLRMPMVVRNTLSLIFLLLSMAFTLVLTFEFGQLVISSYRYKIVSAAVFEIPQFIPQLVMPLGFGLLFLALADQVLRIVTVHSEESERRP